MTKYATPEGEPTAFQQLLLDYMWSQRPPLTNAQLGLRLGVNKGTIQHWIRYGHIPRPEMLGRMSDRLGIPLATLYQAAGYPVPTMIVPAQTPMQTQQQPAQQTPQSQSQQSRDDTPAPRVYQPPAKLPADAWDTMIAHTVDAMRASGLSSEAIQAVVDHMRATLAGERPLQRHIIAEHTVDADTSPPQPRKSARKPSQSSHTDEQDTQPIRTPRPSQPRR